MFARSASTTRRARTPLGLLIIGLCLVLAAAFGPPVAVAGDPGHSGDARYRGQVISLLRHMTPKQKVGQLFVLEVAGRDAYTVSDQASAVNQRAPASCSSSATARATDRSSCLTAFQALRPAARPPTGSRRPSGS